MANGFRFGVKPAIFLLALLPLALLLSDALWSPLRANPYPVLIRQTGLWSLRFLLLGLAVTPLRQLTGWGRLIRLRRMLGLYGAFYAGVHLIVWAMDYAWDWSFLIEETFARTYLTIGLVSTILLLPLAATSFKSAVQRLGGRVWRRLHWLVYPAVLAGYLHYWLAGRLTAPELLLDGMALALLLGWRVFPAMRAGTA